MRERALKLGLEEHSKKTLLFINIFTFSLSLTHTHTHIHTYTHTCAHARACTHALAVIKKRKRKMNKINTHYNGRSTLDEFLCTRMMKHKTYSRKKQKGMASKKNTEKRKEKYSI